MHYVCVRPEIMTDASSFPTTPEELDNGNWTRQCRQASEAEIAFEAVAVCVSELPFKRTQRETLDMISEAIR